MLRDVADKLVHEERSALSTATLVTNGVLDRNLGENGAIVQRDLQSISNGALLRAVVLFRELGFLNTEDLGPELIDARISGGGVGVALRGKFAKDQRVGNHVVDSVVTVGKVVERSLLVDNTNGGFLCADADTLDVVGSLAHSLELLVKDVRSLHSGLSVEFSREGDLEKHVLHDIRAIRPLELEGLALCQNS